MAHRAVSIASRVHSLQPIANPVTVEKQGHRSDNVNGQVMRAAFATRAHAQLLDALGWQISISPRREVERHAPLQCCFVLRDGQREEAVFGYTNLTAPLDVNDPVLRAAQSRVEHILSFLGEDRGVLLQNMPLFAFGETFPDQIAVFGGWRFQGGTWKPFFLGPDGLAGIEAQEVLFARGTAPHHMADTCGHSAKAITPWIASLVRRIEMLNGKEDEAGQAVVPGPGFDGLQVVPSTSGWLKARTCRSSEITPVDQSYRNTSQFRRVGSSIAKAAWESGADEFRFHELGMNRKART